MKGQILAVDFENKKLLKNTQQKSDKKTNKHYFNHTQVCDGTPPKNDYPITQNKVDVESLKTCLMAYDLRKEGTDILEIGMSVMWVSGAEAKDLVEDGRSRGKEYDIGELRSHSNKAVKKYWRVYDKVIGQLEKKQAKEEAIFERAIENDNKGKTEKGLATIGRQQIDYLSERRIEEAMLKEGYLKTYEERTKRKRYIRTHTHRLLAKAEANIKEVGKGRFGVGHKMSTELKLRNEI